MKKKLLLFYFLFVLAVLALPGNSLSQNVGIGTTTPNTKAALDIRATDKGVLFPMLTSAQRNAISNPPDGLHIFNKDERCLNYYDSLFQVWNCYCETDTCKTVTIYINDDLTAVDFYAAYAIKYPGIKKFVILTREDVIINGSSNSAAFNFTTMPASYAGTKIRIINNGSIYGAAGTGGQGAAGQVGSICSLVASSGTAGGHAISTIPGITISITNYGIVAGGGGGGGGGGRSAEGQYGGGGGGGAGLPFGTGGAGGGNTSLNICIPTCVCILSGGSIAGSGTTGTNVTPGTGGTGASGGGNGGNGGGLAQTGQPGTGSSAGSGGTAGKAINGGSGNSITNIGGGSSSFGVVD